MKILDRDWLHQRRRLLPEKEWHSQRQWLLIEAGGKIKEEIQSSLEPI